MTTHAKATPEEQLRAIIADAVTDRCLLAEEIEPRDRELAERIWTLTNERLELPVLALPVGRGD